MIASSTRGGRGISTYSIVLKRYIIKKTNRWPVFPTGRVFNISDATLAPLSLSLYLCLYLIPAALFNLAQFLIQYLPPQANNTTTTARAARLSLVTGAIHNERHAASQQQARGGTHWTLGGFILARLFHSNSRTHSSTTLIIAKCNESLNFFQYEDHVPRSLSCLSLLCQFKKVKV